MFASFRGVAGAILRTSVLSYSLMVLAVVGRTQSKGMTMGEKSHIVYRENDSGRLIKKEDAERMPKSDYTREHMPNPGRGDTGRGGKK